MHLRITLTGWLKLLSILMLLIYCFMYTSHCLCKFCVWSLFCYALLSVLSSFGIILPRKITPVAFALIVFVMSSLSSSRCRGWSTVCGCGPGHTHLLFFYCNRSISSKDFYFLASHDMFSVDSASKHHVLKCHEPAHEILSYMILLA